MALSASSSVSILSLLPGLVLLPAQRLSPLLLQLYTGLPLALLGRDKLSIKLAVLRQDTLQLVLVLLLSTLELLVHLPVVCIVHELLDATLQVPLLLALVLEVLDLALLPLLLLLLLVLLSSCFQANLPAEGLDFCKHARAIVVHHDATLRLGVHGWVVALRDVVLLEQSGPPGRRDGGCVRTAVH